LLTLAPRGVTITNLSTAYDALRRVVTITAAGAGTMSGGAPGVTVNAAARTVTVRLNVFANFAGLVVAGNSGTDSVTIGRQGVNLAAVTAGAANQSFVVSTATGAGDTIVVGGPVTTKGTGGATLAAAGIRLAAPVRTAAGAQTFAGAVTLATNAGLTSGGPITFGGAVDGRRSLSLNAAGSIAFVGAVGATTPLTGLTLSRAASVAIGDGLALDGTGTATGTSGLTIGRGVNNVVFSALGSATRTIQNFSGSGIRFLGGSTGSMLTGIVSRRNAVGLSMAAGDYRGTRITGNTFEANRSVGVLLDGTRNLLFGGANAGATVLGNRITGRLLTGEGSTGMTIRGRAFGTLVQGNTITYHLGDGLRLADARGVTIGGQSPGVGNTISVNLGAGLSVTGACQGSTAEGNTVRSNRRGNGEPPSLRGPV
jgi:hypothetical protein